MSAFDKVFGYEAIKDEAGHVVISEVLCPESVELASVRTTGRLSTNGFIHRCKNWEHKEHNILVCLAGKAAVELYYSDSCADGRELDLRRAFTGIRDYISQDAILGTSIFSVRDSVVPPIIG